MCLLLYMAQRFLHTPRLALDLVVVLCVVIAEGTTLLLELVDADGRQLGCAVVLGAQMVCLMYRDCGVDGSGLDSLLVDNWLNGLVNMMVHVLTLHGRGLALGVQGIGHIASVLVLGRISSHFRLDLLMVSVVELPILNGGDIVLVFFG